MENEWRRESEREIVRKKVAAVCSSARMPAIMIKTIWPMSHSVFIIITYYGR